ncbi:MAG: tRNA (adenosine(37)-N6)-threonylcarbamoyltransferase complex transferase subunit TsaD [Rhodospirillales bacterium]|nr:tRNA (adenosine(37)-N6)-threonylcarbamoyltransferase complex transferase subunit TsaD [Rhodospirillales bacterium]MDH3910824.1 tRNA (adenosine(37)-N6)-threonylcarbamoyltransferase complex transferase subunit TsaD [Rhodospirillales bacterium]MDH3917275.1 tRNA (adenosine(37)-N6)-threonylcarbamoyltransferase complex transferase subunit TsaD [Rhodospirillales bacterium]
MIVLGIETSCDETAAAVVTGEREIRSNLVLSQLAEHRPFGGIVPEIAARSHLDHLDGLVARALDEAGAGFDDLDGVAATAGPGLIGGIFVGVMTAKAIALARALPFLAVNHLEGHALSVRLTEDLAFPYLLLLISGGHCQLLAVEEVGRYRRLGGTIDDAVGEAFDKSAKLLGLPYPGGPAVERAAKMGDPARFDLPRPLIGRDTLDFSFSGLKTAVRHKAHALGLLSPGPDPQAANDLAAGFQAAVGDVLADRCRRALARFQEDYDQAGPLVVAGGVAANGYLRGRLAAAAEAGGARFMAPPQALCTDNAAMIAWAGIERLARGLTDPLDFAPRPRWPLEELTGRAA